MALKRSVFNSLLAILQGNMNCFESNDYVECPCLSIDESETLDFTIDGKLYAIPLSILKVRVSLTNCVLLIIAIDYDMIILGVPFLR